MWDLATIKKMNTPAEIRKRAAYARMLKEVGVPTESKSNMDRQPHIVMQGWCEEVTHTKDLTLIK